MLNRLDLPVSGGATSVLFVPVRFPDIPETFWALIDSGAQVSVISAGLCTYLELLNADLTNVHRARFNVSGFNGATSYMPFVHTYLRLGS